MKDTRWTTCSFCQCLPLSKKVSFSFFLFWSHKHKTSYHGELVLCIRSKSGLDAASKGLKSTVKSQPLKKVDSWSKCLWTNSTNISIRLRDGADADTHPPPCKYSLFYSIVYVFPYYCWFCLFLYVISQTLVYVCRINDNVIKNVM